MAPDVTFGPSGNQWHYTRRTKTYDLTRGASAPKFTVATTSGPPDTAITLNPAATALVVVDMQNFFLDGRCRAHPAGLAAVPPTLDVIRQCREVGIAVVWLNWGLTDDDLAAMPAGVQRGFARDLVAEDDEQGGQQQNGQARRSGLGADLGDGRGLTLMAGSWNAAIYAPLAAAVADADTHCAKNRMSGLWSPAQPLWRHLEARIPATRTLLFAGVNTDQCVLGTLTDAYSAGWDCVLVDDCCATTTDHGRGVCLHNVANSYGFVTSSDAIMAGKLS